MQTKSIQNSKALRKTKLVLFSIRILQRKQTLYKQTADRGIQGNTNDVKWRVKNER